MPRFFFHLLDDVDAPDQEGKELLNLAEARDCAVRHALFTMADTVKEEAKLVRSHRIQIEDADGNVLATVYFGDVVRIED